MKNSLVEFCIEEAKKRVLDCKHKMNCYQYITYFCKRYELSIEEDLKIRQEISKYIDEKMNVLFPVSFTINGN